MADLEDDIHFDLILLDIELAKINGVEVSRHIREINKITCVKLFISLLKWDMLWNYFRCIHFTFDETHTRETLFSCLGEYLRLYSKKDFFELTNKNVKKRIPIEQIQYFESNGRRLLSIVQMNHMNFMEN